MKRAPHLGSELPVLSKAILEQERRMLLDLGNDIIRVREKNDLLQSVPYKKNPQQKLRVL